MRVFHQSPALRARFQQQVEQKVSVRRDSVRDKLGGGLLGTIGVGMFQFQELKNTFKGNLGETYLSLLARFLPDTWIMFNNALIPTTTGKLTEIDILLVGLTGVFLIEVKTWKGSFSAYRDQWKRREGNSWIPLDSSPTEQSNYHQKMFQRWINSQVSGLPADFIVAPVVFPASQWLGVKECSVPVFQEISDLKRLLERDAYLTSEQVSQIGEAIEDFEGITKTATVTPRPILKKQRN